MEQEDQTNTRIENITNDLAEKAEAVLRKFGKGMTNDEKALFAFAVLENVVQAHSADIKDQKLRDKVSEKSVDLYREATESLGVADGIGCLIASGYAAFGILIRSEEIDKAIRGTK